MSQQWSSIEIKLFSWLRSVNTVNWKLHNSFYGNELIRSIEFHSVSTIPSPYLYPVQRAYHCNTGLTQIPRLSHLRFTLSRRLMESFTIHLESLESLHNGFFQSTLLMLNQIKHRLSNRVMSETRQNSLKNYFFSVRWIKLVNFRTFLDNCSK